MKIDIKIIDPEQFNIVPRDIGGELCHLVCAKNITTKWNKDNMFLRSVMVNSSGAPINCGWPKFYNLGEHPELYPDPKTFKDWVVDNKEDGSLICVSRYNGEHIIRTRGSIGFEGMESSHEIADYLSQHPAITDNEWVNGEGYTLLFEYLSPTNVIVLRHSIVEFVLIGVIENETYRILTHAEVDIIAEKIGIRRPERYTFDTIEDIVSNCAILRDREGYVLSYNNNQNRVKLKGSAYLSLHRFKEHATLENTIDLYFAYGQPDYQTFEKKLTEAFDYECFSMVRSYASQICDASKEMAALIQAMREKVEPLRNMARKDAAAVILQAYGQTNRASFAFKMLDFKPLGSEDLVKLIYQLLKK